MYILLTALLPVHVNRYPYPFISVHVIVYLISFLLFNVIDFELDITFHFPGYCREGPDCF